MGVVPQENGGSMEEVRTRFAPSPTGYLHIALGGQPTYKFNISIPSSLAIFSPNLTFFPTA